MYESSYLPPNSSFITGARIWLSGSIPEEYTEKQKNAIIDFVNDFSEKVFQLGGHILYGSHPSFTPILLKQAEKHLKNGGKKDCLTLCMSRYYSKNTDGKYAKNFYDLEDKCTVYETPEAIGVNAQEDSLKILRTWMAARCDAFVGVGGKMWQQIASRAGVPKELDYAIQRSIPCFVLGGLGGATRNYLEQHPELLFHLKNGLDETANRVLANEENVGCLVQKVCKQLGLLPLVRGRGADGVSFRILALDGGGIKGAFTASILATWEQQTKLNIINHFDLIAGTSTGGIIAVGLGIGLSGERILDFYRQRGSVIFPITSFSRRLRYTLRHMFRPKYSQEVLLRELEKAYYTNNIVVTLKDSKCRLLIPAYHAIAGASHVFRTPHCNILTADAETPVAQVALATAAAPTFFSAAKVGNMIAKSSYFDGGVWANSPAMAAIIEAVCFLGIPLDRIDVLSVGTTEEPFTVREQTRSGILRWSKKLIRLLLTVQEESCLKHARLLAGEPRFLRVNVMTIPGCYRLDGPKEIEELIAHGNLKALEPEVLVQIRSRFLNGVFVNPWKRFS